MSSIIAISTQEAEPDTETDYYKNFLHCQKCGTTNGEIFISIKLGSLK